MPFIPRAADESPVWRRAAAATGRRPSPWLVMLLVATLALVGVAAGATSAVAPAAASEVAEEAGTSEESTDSRRTETRRRRALGTTRRRRRTGCRPRPLPLLRQSPGLVVPTACAPRRGPPLLSC